MGTVIEAGHFYTCTGPTSVSLQGWEIGKGLAGRTDGSALVLFVDDYHEASPFMLPGEVSAGSEAETEMKAGAGQIYYESVIAARSLSAVLELLDDGLVKLKKGAVSVGGVRWGTFTDDKKQFNPTCTLIDRLLVEEKATVGGDQVVVLPQSYEQQQGQLGIVLGKLVIPELTSYTVKLFDPRGVVSEVAL